MFESEEYGYVMDFKAEDKRTQSAVFEIENIYSDCSTRSASETNDLESNCSTPPLLCKLKKARVMIKKLPRHVLEKYNLSCKERAPRPSPIPSRTSKRKGAKTVPGQYLSVHVNKPLDVLANKKRRLKKLKTIVKAEPIYKKNNKLQNENIVSLSNKSNSTIEASSSGSARTTARSLHERIASTRHKYKNDMLRSSNPSRLSSFRKVPSHMGEKDQHENMSFAKENHHEIPHQKPVATAIPSVRNEALLNRPSLPESLPAAANINMDNCFKKPTVKSIPKYPDVVITQYELPQTSISGITSNPSSISITNAQLNSVQPTGPNHGSAFIQNYQHPNPRLLSAPQHNITLHFPLPYKSRFPYYSQCQSFPHAYPTHIIPVPPTHQPSFQTVIAHPSESGVGSRVKENSEDLLKKTIGYVSSGIQTSSPPTQSSVPTDAVIVDSSKTLVINQPSLKSDPLDVPGSKSNQNKFINAESDMETCAESDSELDLSDAESRFEPQVVKRIIYHTKAVQTKFTCNGTICGLVDSDEFKLNCFYCYELFPLHKWQEFKRHVKLVHHVEEKENQKEIERDNNSTENKRPNIKKPNITNLCSKQTSKPIVKAKSPPQQNSTEQCYKKLPLEPRLVAQLLNKMATNRCQNLSDIPKSPELSKFLNTSQASNKASHNDSAVDDIISLDSDGGEDLDTMDIDDNDKDVTKTPEKVNENSNLINSTNANADEIANLLPPSLKHITVKKVANNTTSVQKLKPLTSQQAPAAKSLAKPRYFVIKKVLKPITTDMKQNITVTKGMIITKMAESVNINLDPNEMPANDDNEDAVPKPTNGSGILFGVTNRMVVIEFLLKLKTFPELWRPQFRNNESASYEKSVKQLCDHLNNRFDLNIQEIEICLSIQRVKIWYSRMLKNIHEHNQKGLKEPYRHKFPLYFKILNQYLTSNVPTNKYAPPSERFKSITNSKIYPNYVVYKTGTAAATKSNAAIQKLQSVRSLLKRPPPPLNPLAIPQPTSIRSLLRTCNNDVDITTLTSKPTPASPSESALAPAPTLTPTPTTQTADDTTPPELNMDNLIEFDADTLYENESSDEEVLEAFDERKKTTKKANIPDEPRKTRTKIYTGIYACDLCEKSFKRRCDVRRHRILHFPPLFKCAICTQMFHFKHWAEKCNHVQKRKFSMVGIDNSEVPEDHKVLVTPKRPWTQKKKCRLICELCGSSYKQLGSLNCHKRDKHFNQRLKCVVCNFTALTNYRIVQHQKKRHIVEPGTVEEVAKRSRPRMDTKTRFSVEARQEFDWRREMRKKLEPGEKFFACCKCRIIFNTRKEKVLHNKMEHPIKETTVCCLLCWPTKFLLSNSNSARRHYTDIHKVPWDEIDALVKRTKPIFNVLSKEEIELLNASENYKELLEQLLKDRELVPIEKVELQDDETSKAVQNLPIITDINIISNKVEEECTQQENVYVDGIIDHDYNNEYNEETYKQEECANSSNNEHNYSEDQVVNNENYVYVADNSVINNEEYAQHSDDINVNVGAEAGDEHLAYNIICSEGEINQEEHVIEEYLQNVAGEYVEDGDLVYEELVEEEGIPVEEEGVVLEECVDEEIDVEGRDYFE